MATAAAPAPAVPASESPASGGGSKLILYGALTGLVLGGTFGGFVLAPRSAAHPAGEEAVLEHAAEPEERDGPANIHEIQNLVVNPANTNGSRFLLVTMSIVVKDAAALEEVAARDAEVRDRVVDFLSMQSIEKLSDASRREALKVDLAAAVGALFQEGIVRRVLLPQFVIQ